MTDKERIENLEQAVKDLFDLMQSVFLSLPDEEGSYYVSSEQHRMNKLYERFTTTLTPPDDEK